MASGTPYLAGIGPYRTRIVRIESSRTGIGQYRTVIVSYRAVSHRIAPGSPRLAPDRTVSYRLAPESNRLARIVSHRIVSRRNRLAMSLTQVLLLAPVWEFSCQITPVCFLHSLQAKVPCSLPIWLLSALVFSLAFAQPLVLPGVLFGLQSSVVTMWHSRSCQLKGTYQPHTCLIYHRINGLYFCTQVFYKVFTQGNSEWYCLREAQALRSKQESGGKQHCKRACRRGEVLSPRTFNYKKRTRVFPHAPLVFTRILSK